MSCHIRKLWYFKVHQVSQQSRFWKVEFISAHIILVELLANARLRPSASTGLNDRSFLTSCELVLTTETFLHGAERSLELFMLHLARIDSAFETGFVTWTTAPTCPIYFLNSVNLFVPEAVDALSWSDFIFRVHFDWTVVGSLLIRRALVIGRRVLDHNSKLKSWSWEMVAHRFES